MVLMSTATLKNNRWFAAATAGLALLGSNVKYAGHLDECYTHDKTHVPHLSGPDGGRTEEPSLSGCQSRCQNTTGCEYFEWWPNKACYLSGSGAKEIDRFGAITGPAVCGVEPSKVNVASGMRHVSELWLIDGVYYDLEPLFERHPGGKNPFQVSRGSDVSVLFQVHHLNDRPRASLQRYAVPAELVQGEMPYSQAAEMKYSFEPDGFYMTLRSRVRKYIEEKDVGSVRMAGLRDIGKWSFNLIVFTSTWYRIVFYDFSYLACFANFLSRVVLMGQAHEAIHTILIPKLPVVERIFSKMGLELMGFNIDEWYAEHVLHHHLHTNTEVDPDVDVEQKIPVWRLTDLTPWYPRHSWPTVMTSLIGLFVPIGNALGHADQFFYPFAVLRYEIIFTFLCMIFIHYLPLFTQPRKSTALKSILLTSCCASLLTLHAFHANHIVDVAQDTPYVPGVDWGVQQVRTTVNFDTWFVSGGLDCQVEHHLFPMLSYGLQEEIKPIVKETCKEFGVTYHNSASTPHHFGRMFSYLAALGWDNSLERLNEAEAAKRGNATVGEEL